MTEVTPNLPHLGNFCKYCFMRTLLVRTSPGYGSNTPEMTCRNYDAEQVEQEYRRVSDQLTALQLTLDRANLLLEFEVELEG